MVLRHLIIIAATVMASCVAITVPGYTLQVLALPIAIGIAAGFSLHTSVATAEGIPAAGIVFRLTDSKSTCRIACVDPLHPFARWRHTP